MISPETRAQIRRYFYAEHWKIGTISRQLGLHPDTVRNAIETGRVAAQSVRPSKLDPYLGFLREVLSQHPTLRATRIYQMAGERGYTGSLVQFRRAVARLAAGDFCPTIKKGAIPDTCPFSTSCKKPFTLGRKMRARRIQQYCGGFHEHSIQAWTQHLYSTARTCANHQEVQSDKTPLRSQSGNTEVGTDESGRIIVPDPAQCRSPSPLRASPRPQ